MNRLLIVSLACGVMLAGAIPLWAQQSAAQAAAEGQQKLMAKRAAELDAYRLMAEKIMGLQITTTTFVRDFVTTNDRISTDLDQFIKGVRFTDIRYFDDGTAEVNAEVTIAEVVTHLKKVFDESYTGGQWTRQSFDEITRNTQERVLKVTGSGAARGDAERSPSTVPDPATAPIHGRAIHIVLPEIYRRFPPNARLMAKRAGELDAYRHLMERIYGLDIGSSTHVGDFVTRDDRIRAATEGFLKGARTEDVRYCEDGTVEVTMSVTIEEIVTSIHRAYDEVYHDGHWNKVTLEDISRNTTRKIVTVLGTGALDAAAATDGPPDAPGQPGSSVHVDEDKSGREEHIVVH